MKMMPATEVLVIGGGLAALSAAISAAEKGGKITVANKGITGKSGSSSKAAGILAAPFGHGGLNQLPIADSPHRHALDSLAIGHNMGSPALIKMMAQNACASVNWLETLGVTFSRDDNGQLIQLNAPGNSRPRACSAIGGGAAIMALMLQTAKQLGIKFFDGMAAYALHKNGPCVVGAALCDANGNTYHINAKSVILCTGGNWPIPNCGW